MYQRARRAGGSREARGGVTGPDEHATAPGAERGLGGEGHDPKRDRQPERGEAEKGDAVHCSVDVRARRRERDRGVRERGRAEDEHDDDDELRDRDRGEDLAEPSQPRCGLRP
jgi:hypothetical protein